MASPWPQGIQFIRTDRAIKVISAEYGAGREAAGWTSNSHLGISENFLERILIIC